MRLWAKTPPTPSPSRASRNTRSGRRRTLRYYLGASERFRLGERGPAILAAIHKVETDFGRSDLPGVHSGENSAGAGPMRTGLASVELETRTIDPALVEQGLVGALRGDRVGYEQTVERIRQLHQLGLVVAERLARGGTLYSGLQRGAVRRAVEALRDAAIIESRGRGDWRFTNPLFKRYLLT